MSRDISKILDNLQGKFLKNATSDKPIGIGQIIGHINEINDGTFQYDTKLDKSKHYNIYSILLLSNRLLEINGINFIFNQWFKSNLNKGNQNFTIKNLVVIDIDTLIFYQEYLKNKDKNFKNILEKHIKNMNSNINGYGKNLNEYENRTMDKISRKLSPFSSRFKNEMFETKDFLNKFSYLVSK